MYEPCVVCDLAQILHISPILFFTLFYCSLHPSFVPHLLPTTNSSCAHIPLSALLHVVSALSCLRRGSINFRRTPPLVGPPESLECHQFDFPIRDNPVLLVFPLKLLLNFA